MTRESVQGEDAARTSLTFSGSGMVEVNETIRFGVASLNIVRGAETIATFSHPAWPTAVSVDVTNASADYLLDLIAATMDGRLNPWQVEEAIPEKRSAGTADL